MNRHRVAAGLVAVLGGIAALSAGSAVAEEKLDRGVVAIARPDGSVYIGWRLLKGDPKDVDFGVSRHGEDGQKVQLNEQPLRNSTDFVDKKAKPGSRYTYVVSHLTNEQTGAGRIYVEAEPNVSPVRAPAEGSAYISIPLQGNYTLKSVALADLDGDGRLDYVVRHPNFNTDPYQRPGYWKKSEDTYKIEAYNHDGKFMWRHDMGWSIEEGTWYAPYIAYDIDGDGKAEVYCKAGEGDPRDEKGLVQTGPEWLAKLDGKTGRIVKKIDWPSREGFSQYNYYCRNFLAVAWLDGKTPSLICQRGTYRLIKTHAYDKNLELIWKWAATEDGPDKSYRGKGSHGFHAADVDGDGRDELVFGSAALDEYGHALWNTGKGHPDGIYVADVDPKRPGLEIYMGIETRSKRGAVCLVDAKTGEEIWGIDAPTKHIHGQGMCADISAKYPGMECYGKERDSDDTWLMSAAGERIGDKPMGGTTPRAVWWDDTPQKALVIRNRIYKFENPDETLGRIEGRIIGIADCIGDWREEIITSVPGELRIYTTTIPATSRRTCLMQNRMYRTNVATQSMGYFYPPQLGLEPKVD